MFSERKFPPEKNENNVDFFFFSMIKFYILCVWSQLKISVGKDKFACVRPSGKNILKIFFSMYETERKSERVGKKEY